MHKLIATTLLSALLSLSLTVFTQSNKYATPSMWLQGNTSGDASRLVDINFNPAMLMNAQAASIKITDKVSSLRRVTIFTVYQNANNDEQSVWKIGGRLGNISLSTRQVAGNDNTSVAFAKDQPAGNKTIAPLIHTYIGRNRQSNDGTENKDATIQWGLSAGGGYIAEFILFERILNEEELAKTETYLALKYGIGLEKNYLNSSGATVWNYKIDKYFSHHIAGIGRDDRTSLYQKQSTSSYQPGELVIGVNKIASSNKTNTGQLSNGDYLIWGDNDQPFTLQETIKTGSDEMLLTGKKWMIRRSGNTDHNISTELAIDIKSLFSHYSKENFFLVIDKSGSGNFNTSDCIYVTPESISKEGIASFGNLQWDVDRSGKDVFAFGLKINPNVSGPDKNKSIRSFRVYPNPLVDGRYKIEVVLEKPADVQIQFYDLHQQLLETKKGSGQSNYL
ncbi:MAG TPA: hypothetical protein VHM26_18205, partial [Chitinophagaceae bacterium]|nr:hypothetical protein [Chitinophagaceae bacterium]